ncbi:hypothetical protein B566_EDAN000652 [Ephemera danica]|nr:hypothetical protein B566_EDAN000652 [Ephemera danica]
MCSKEEDQEYEQHETFIRNQDSIKEDQNVIPLFREEDPKYLKHKSSQSFSVSSSEVDQKLYTKIIVCRDKYKGRERERTPNLLTWAEKEKIRSLYKEYPDEWTLDRLSGNFPATKATIKIILKEKWEPKDVKLHDEAVNKHWRQLLAGEIEVSPNLKHHLLSFAPKQLVKQQKIEDSNECQDHNAELEEVQQREKSEDQNLLTKTCNLQQLPISLNQQNKSNKFDNKNLEAWSTTGSISKYQTKRVKVEQKTVTNLCPLPYCKTECCHSSHDNTAIFQKPLYPERIRIPEEKWQEGATYKVGDVYYDSDGEFLYRVPGLT